jgi:hypothetical protein
VVTDQHQDRRRARVHLGRFARRIGRRAADLGRGGAGRGVGLVVIVVAARAWLGVWPAAVLGAAVLTAGLVVGLAAIERQEIAPRRDGGPVVLVGEPGRRGHLEGQASHVAFARGLAGLSAWYLAECERQENQR